MLEKVQRNVREWTWLIRYLALACLFGSVYTLLLRPVKKQVLTALRELPLRPANKLITAGGVTGQATALHGREAAETLIAESENNPALKKLSALKDHLVEKVRSEPAGASQLVQSWLREGGVE